MWVFCKSGMFSAVKHNAKENVILLRARLEGDLERLLKKHGLDGKCKVEKTPSADYRFRCEMDKADWVMCMVEESEDIDYGNFKNAVHDGTVRDSAYMGCWFAMAEAQDEQAMGRKFRDKSSYPLA